MKKRLLSILLMCCMVLTLLPTTAFAEESTETPPVCTCETACAVETMNAECSVCGAEDASAENCAKYIKPADDAAVQPEGEVSDPQPETALTTLIGGNDTLKEVNSESELTNAIADSTVGTVKLAGDISISSSLTVNRTVTLDLNGYVLQMTGSGSVIKVESSGNLTLTDSDDKKEHKFNKSVMPWALAADDATGENIVAVPGGVITGGTGYPYQLSSTVNCGGGVYIAPGGQLTMTGGNIIGCSAEYGGGVCIYPKRDGEQGQFSMSGGNIIGCSAESGGGVCAFGKFQMSGQAVIRSCTAEGPSFNCGGGVNVDGSFEMSGEAIIEGCQAISEYAYGGGVYVNSSSSFVMTDKAEIEGCQAISTPSSPSKGGGVHLANNTEFTLSGSAAIKKCMAVNSAGSGETYGGGVSANNVKKITLADSASIAACTAANGSGLYITGSSWDPNVYGQLYANGGLVDGDVVLGNKDRNDEPCTITGLGGTVFKGKVTVTPGSTIEKGTFNGEVINNGTITGGVFNNTVSGSGTITGGTFNTPMTGSGTKNDPYQISTAEQLKLFRDIVNGAGGQTQNRGAYAVLTANIDLNNEPWTPIGNYTEGNQIYYEGTFDGGGHTISGLNVTGEFVYAGLFGTVKDGTIKSLTVAGKVSPSNSQCIVGGIVGYASNAVIKNCSNHCSVTGRATSIIGGIAGFNSSGAIIDCYNVGTISGINYAEAIGGIVGSNSGTISNCYNVGTVSNDTSVGEIAGHNNGTVENCYYLAGTNLNAVGQNNSNGNITKTESKTAANFANGTVLNLLINGRADSEHPWYETCIYLEAAGKTLPVFKWQHQHQLTHVLAKDPTTSEVGNIEYWYCPVCGKYFADANGDHEITQAETVIPKRQSSGGGSGGSSSYPITVPSKTENGTVTVSPKNASAGSTVTITVKPDSGYVLETISVTDKNGNDLKLTDKSNGKYTFTMPTSKVEIKVTFMEDNSVLNFFYDVPNDAYYYEAVKWAAENGITGGVGNSLFAPNQPCTRAQIVTFLWRAAGSPAPKSMSSFTDVPADAFYAKAVAWAVENGITSGTGESKFSPNATCTRAQAVTFLYRASGSPAVSGSAEFSDVATNAYYADAVAWAAKKGITTGIGGGLFGSDNDCTRSQIVTFLWRCKK